MRKGISLTSVVTVTFLLLLLTTTATISITKMNENAEKLAFASELSSLQTTVDSFFLANGEYPVTDENILVDVTNAGDAFKKENIQENTVVLSKIDYEKIGYVSLNYEASEYGISLDTGIVYYAKGVTIGGSVYYTLTDELKKIVSSTKNSDIVTKNAVLFLPSNAEWTNEEVEVLVKVPKEYSNILVSTSSSVNYTLDSEDDDYYIYTIKEKENYEVVVSYLDENKVSKEAKYSVKNYDNKKPTLEVDRHVTLSEEYNSDIYGYFTVTKVEDTESGIKEVKYECGKIDGDVVSYFKTNGEKVVDDKIMIKRGYEYITVYAVDNAGNYVVGYLKV